MDQNLCSLNLVHAGSSVLATAAPAQNPSLRWKSCSTHLVFGEGQQRREALATYGTHVMFGGAAVRLSVLPETVLREEGPGTHIALVVSFNEICLLLSGTWHTEVFSCYSWKQDDGAECRGQQRHVLPASSSPGRMLWSRSLWFCSSDSMV